MSPPPQISSDILLRSINNLINICENSPSDLSRHRDKLNFILNDLNAMEFKYVQTLDIFKVSHLHWKSNTHLLYINRNFNRFL